MSKAGVVGLEWTIACYHEAEVDIRWAKERATGITYWSVLLASTAVASSKVALLPTWMTTGFCVLQAGVAILWLYDLHAFAKAARGKVHEFLPEPDLYPIKIKDDADPHHIKQLISQGAVVLAAAGVAIAAIVARFASPAV